MLQNICPICTASFQDKEIILEYRSWEFDKPSDPRFAHVDCLLYLSKIEKRDHPPSK